MEKDEHVVHIHTFFGSAEVICRLETTIRELTGMAMRLVSLTSTPQLYGLQLPIENASEPNLLSRYLLCPALSWKEVYTLHKPKELLLRIALYPTKFEEAARSDRLTLFYLYHQARDLYYTHFDSIQNADLAFELGCLEMRSIVPNTDLHPKGLIELVEKARSLSSFFPACVFQHYKGKALRKAVQNYLFKINHYCCEDCILDMLNRYLLLLQFDRDIIPCWFGAGYGIPAELVIGPRFQVSIQVENAREPRLLAHFATIRQVMILKANGSEGSRYQLRLSIEPSMDPSIPLELMTFAFQIKEEADTVVHLLQGYCGEAIGAVVRNGNTGSIINSSSHGSKELFLPNQCPFRYCESGQAIPCKMELKRDLVVLKQVLGEGQFGEVYKGSFKKSADLDPIPIAVKTCKIDSSQEDRRQFLSEATILSQFNHPHIIPLIGVCSTDPIWLIMEYAPLGELRHYLLANQEEVTLFQRLTYCYQIGTALTCLETNKCVHRDIAARNVLVVKEDWIKLADFGMAKMLHGSSEFKADKGRKLPIKWMPPESIHERRFNSASDVWMFGVCMWEILSSGTKPFADLTNAEAVDLITKGQRLKRPNMCPPTLYALMLECWNSIPQRRPTFALLKPKLREVAAQTKSAKTPVPVAPNLQTPNEQPNNQVPSTEALNVNSKAHSKRSSSSSEQISISSLSNTSAIYHGTDTSMRSENERKEGIFQTTCNITVLTPISTRSSGGSKEQFLTNGVVFDDTPGSSPNPGRSTHCDQLSAYPTSLHKSPASSRGASANFQDKSPQGRTSALSLDDYLRSNLSDRPNSRQNQDFSPLLRSRESQNWLKLPVNHDSAESSKNNSLNKLPTEQDSVYQAAVNVVQTVRYSRQQLFNIPATNYNNLGKEIGISVRNMFAELYAKFPSQQPGTAYVFSAQDQLKSSMYQLITALNRAKLEANRGPLLEEYRRSLMGMFFAVANDAHALCNAVRQYDIQHPTPR